MADTTRLIDELTALHRGYVNPAALIEAFRRGTVLCPLTDGGLTTADLGGINWLYAFTSEQALARFAVERGEGAKEWEFARMEGARLLDVAVPALNFPVGVAVDVGSPAAVLFPPVAGIVPDAVALDASPALRNASTVTA
jgi:hypothetical protein